MAACALHANLVIIRMNGCFHVSKRPLAGRFDSTGKKRTPANPVAISPQRTQRTRREERLSPQRARSNTKEAQENSPPKELRLICEDPCRSVLAYPAGFRPS